jgi:hypothetical protein
MTMQSKENTGAACNQSQADEKDDDTPIKVFGLVAMHSEQKPLIEKHCLGDCGKLSIGGVITDPMTGGLWVCCEAICPWLKVEMTEPYGTTMSFGRPHEVYLRSLTDTPSDSTRGRNQ